MYRLQRDLPSSSQVEGHVSFVVIALLPAFLAIYSALPPSSRHSARTARLSVPMSAFLLSTQPPVRSVGEQPEIPSWLDGGRTAQNRGPAARQPPSRDLAQIPPADAGDLDRPGLDWSLPTHNS